MAARALFMNMMTEWFTAEDAPKPELLGTFADVDLTEYLTPESEAEEESGSGESPGAAGGDSGAALDRAFRTLAASGLPVRMMREEKESLEEVFFRSIDR